MCVCVCVCVCDTRSTGQLRTAPPHTRTSALCLKPHRRPHQPLQLQQTTLMCLQHRPYPYQTMSLRLQQMQQPSSRQPRNPRSLRNPATACIQATWTKLLARGPVMQLCRTARGRFYRHQPRARQQSLARLQVGTVHVHPANHV